MQEDGTPYLLESEEDFGVRIAVTWNVHWTCSDKVLNEVSYKFLELINVSGCAIGYNPPDEDHAG